MSSTLALLGGTPVRTRPFPEWPIFGREEEERLIAVLRSGRWGRIHGDEVARFEQRFAAYHAARHGIAVVNGTVALRVALLAAGIEAGDEVIVPPYTFLATASAVIECNATPIFADVRLDTFNLDPAAVEAAVTPRTRAIIPVHLGGCPADLDALRRIAYRHGLLVIEDAAQAHGAQYRGTPVGAIGAMGTFSFQSSKNLNCGEGGIILTNDDDLAEICRSVHNCGRIADGAWYEHHVIGGNYRLTEFQGALLDAQFDRFEAQAARREENGRYLAERLASLPGIFPQVRDAACTRHAYHLFLFRLELEDLGISRSVFLEALRAEGIPASEGYLIPLYQQPVFAEHQFGPYAGWNLHHPDLDYAKVECPNCESLCERSGAWLEQRLLLGTRADMDDIHDAFDKILTEVQTGSIPPKAWPSHRS